MDYTNDYTYHGKLRQVCQYKHNIKPGDEAYDLMQMKSESSHFNPLGFYKRAFYHLTNNEPFLTNLGGAKPLPEFSGKITYAHYPQ